MSYYSIYAPRMLNELMNNIYVSTYLKWCEEDLRMGCIFLSAVNIQQHGKEGNYGNRSR